MKVNSFPVRIIKMYVELTPVPIHIINLVLIMIDTLCNVNLKQLAKSLPIVLHLALSLEWNIMFF